MDGAHTFCYSQKLQQDTRPWKDHSLYSAVNPFSRHQLFSTCDRGRGEDNHYSRTPRYLLGHRKRSSFVSCSRGEPGARYSAMVQSVCADVHA